jgi:REP element-mobilizing transposase RayT
MARANDKQRLFRDVDDRLAFLRLLSVATDTYEVEWEMFVLMTTHFHAKVTTPHANISAAMQFVLSRFAEGWNRRRRRRGHVLEGRFKAPLIEDGRYAMSIIRYIALNPVKANYVEHARDWPWSSHRALAGMERRPPFLRIDWLRNYFDGPTLRDCQRQYRSYVDGCENEPIQIEEPIAIGSAGFASSVRSLIGNTMHDVIVPRSYRALGRPPVGQLFADAGDDPENRNQMMLRAQVVYGYTQAEIARTLGLHPNTVSKITRRVRRQRYFLARSR